jgi:enoyl-CoA hydratase
MFADTHARVGIHPGWGMTQLLQQAVGQRMARQMSMTCQFMDAQTALRTGLVNEVVSHDELLPRAMQLAGFICEGREDMLMVVKELIEYRNNATLEEAYKNERTGFRAFVKKSVPSL